MVRIEGPVTSLFQGCEYGSYGTVETATPSFSDHVKDTGLLA